MSLGEALVTLRRAKGLTQKALAAEAGITQATLSRYENELRDPADGPIGTLADALGVTKDFLKRTHRSEGAFMVDAHMRRRRTAKVTVWRRLEARLNVYRMHLNLLHQAVEVEPTLTLPQFDPLEYSPADAARIVRMQWRMPSGPIRNLAGWLESAGCILVTEDFGLMTGGGRVDGLSQWAKVEGDWPIMLINSRAPTDRLRLTLAHELAHICLHSEELGGDAEEEANAFAAEFLMPEVIIRPELHNLSLGKLHALKRYWGVSMQALVERAYRLDTLTSTRRTSLYRALSARGWLTREPLSDELSPERPQLVERLSRELLNGGLTHDEIATIAGVSADGERPCFLPKPRLSIV